MSFRITLTEPVQKVAEYLAVLKAVNFKGLQAKHILATSPCANKVNACANNCLLSNNLNFRAALYCAMVHPRHFVQYGSVESWYKTDQICEQLKKGGIYKPEGLQTLAQDIKNQKPFVEKIQKIPHPDVSIVQFEQFMTLVKKYDGVHKLSPTFPEDIVWHAYMLDHKNYIKATTEYFGRPLDHDDSPKSKEALQKQRALTQSLREKHFGKSSVDSSSTCDTLFWILHSNGCSSSCSDSSCSSCD